MSAEHEASLSQGPHLRDVMILPSPSELVFHADIAIQGMKMAQALHEGAPALTPHALSKKQLELDKFRERPESALAWHYLALAGVELGFEVSEQQRTPLSLVTDVNNNIAINGQPISMDRKLKKAFLGHDVEIEGRRVRVEVLKMLATNPGKFFHRQEIWQAIMGGTHLNDDYWEAHIEPLLKQPPEYNGEPIIQIDKQVPPFYHYGLGPFDVALGEASEAFDIADQHLFVLPNGKVVGGNSGRLLNMLMRASADDPVKTEHILEDENFYTAEQLANSRTPLNKKLSTLVSALKSQYLNGTNIKTFRVRLPDDDPLNPGLLRSGYYGRYVSQSFKKAA